MARSKLARMERTLGAASRFLEDVRFDVERAVVEGMGIAPRLRSMHERVGHATPEYRTLAIPVPDGVAGSSPELLSEAIARYIAGKAPDALLLALDLAVKQEAEPATALLICEARDSAENRLFWTQRYQVQGPRVRWEEPEGGGWRDPGDEEMILDAAFLRRRPREGLAQRVG